MVDHSIIVATMHRTDLLSRCVDSIAKYSKNYQLQVIHGQLTLDAFDYYGIRGAASDTCVFLHDDCEVMTDGWLTQMESVIPSNGGIVIPRMKWMADRDGIQTMDLNLRLSAWSIGDFPSIFCFMFKKQWFHNNGGFDRSFERFAWYGSDEDFLARTCLAGGSIVCNRAVEVSHVGMGTIGAPEGKGVFQEGARMYLKERYKGRIPA